MRSVARAGAVRVGLGVARTIRLFSILSKAPVRKFIKGNRGAMFA